MSSHDWLRPGMTAEVRILVDHLENVLLVPLTAVTTRGNETFCFLANGERRVLKTGLFNDEYIEIQDGLEAGEVIAANPRAFLDGIDDGSGEIRLWLPESETQTSENRTQAQAAE
jgi:multidrug efflux pump subunit AcrA (membrane-fusion protein)